MSSRVNCLSIFIHLVFIQLSLHLYSLSFFELYCSLLNNNHNKCFQYNRKPIAAKKISDNGSKLQHQLSCAPVMGSVLRMNPDTNCSICGGTFSKTSNLNRHLKIHDDHWWIKCEHCWFKTKRNYILKNHVEMYHPFINNNTI